MLVKRFRVTVDQKRFLMERRSTANDGHPRVVSTVQVPQVGFPPTFKGSECPCRFLGLRALHTTTRSRGPGRHSQQVMGLDTRELRDLLRISPQLDHGYVGKQGQHVWLK
jgi:hypothetical protein